MSGLVRYQSPSLSVSSLFDDLFSGWDPWDKDLPTTLSPKVDVVEEKDSYKVTAEIPGMDKKDLKVEIADGILSISGEKKEEKSEKDKDRYYHYERSYGSFKREFRLSDGIDPENVEAKYANGVLELVLKKTEKAKPKQVEVKIE
jgi:HSP20 family protein